jgi:dynein heavy chain
MQKPVELTWNNPKCLGDVPSKRSGHSFTIIGDYGYLFGGSDFRKPSGPNNELYKVDMLSGDFYWIKKENNQKCPPPRSHHTAIEYGSKIVIFGGFKNSHIRYNDVWIYDTITEEWNQPPLGITTTKENGETSFEKEWPGIPLPRGSHTATLIQEKYMLIFGGYGGSGYARRDFNDVNILDLESWEWRTIECSGDIPEARSGHQAAAVQNNLYIIGGWNSMAQFNSIHILDLKTNVWKLASVTGDIGPPRWNMSAVSVCAVPHWKIFIFGGNSGDLNDISTNPQGDYRNDLVVLDTGSLHCTKPDVVGPLPAPRGETEMVYDPKFNRLLLYGGWANRWYGDTFTCKISDIVGPPYAISSISPKIGPLTGGTCVEISGIGFKSGGSQVIVRLACSKGFIETSGEIVDNQTIKFETPNYEKYGVTDVEIRLSIGGKALSISTASFSFFSVTSCDTTVVFGPAILNGVVARYPSTAIIHCIKNTS